MVVIVFLKLFLPFIFCPSHNRPLSRGYEKTLNIMAAKYGNRKRYDVVEFLKRDYSDWSNSTDSKISEYIENRSMKLKTLPAAHGKEVNKVIEDLKAALPNISPKQVRRFISLFI